MVGQDNPHAKDVDALRWALAASERRAATLAELAGLMNEGRDPLALAQRAVELTARATKSAGAYVYLWDRDDERLVLRVATEGWQRRHLGSIRLRLGEGITGWSALMRQSVMVAKDPADDPRFKPFPELRESTFKSMVAVPIVAPGEEVLGVFTLYAPSEDAFQSTDVSLATEVGTILASGLVQAETLAQLQVQSTAARFLHDLPDGAWTSLQQCLRVMAEHCVADLEAEICSLEVTTDRTLAQGAVHVVATSEKFADQHADIAQHAEKDKATLAQNMAPLKMSRLRIPLGVVAPIGQVTLYRSRRFTPQDEVLLEAIGAQIAAGALSLIGAESLRPVRDQLLASPDAEGTERLLLLHGWKRRSTTPVILRFQMGRGTTAGNDVRSRDLLVETMTEPGRRLKLLGDAGHFVALLETPDPLARDLLVNRLTDLGDRSGVRITAGVGPITSSLREVHRSILQATLASQWAMLAGGESTVVPFEDVVHLRMAPGAVLGMSEVLRTLLASFGVIVSYDLEHGTDLALTLEVFFANSGSVARTSKVLFIHRNTLRQRIQRIEELIGQAPESFDDWISAGLAARLIRQSRAELLTSSTVRPGQRCPHGVVTIGKSCCGSTAVCALSPQGS